MIKIPLTQGKVALIDDEDADLLLPYKWCASGRKRKSGLIVYYAMRGLEIDGKFKAVHMHRVIANPKPEEDVDHRNGDTLDNRRANLRCCTRSQNSGNTHIFRRDNTTGFKGIYFHRQMGKWAAQIAKTHIGIYVTAEEAARAYDRAAIARYGEFAALNFPATFPRGAKS